MARILVADDETSFLDYLAEALTTRGHQVERASDGVEAAGLLSKRAFQVVVTDLKMPRMTGLQLLHWLKERQPEVEVIVLTAHGSVASAVEAMKAGAFDFLEKPLESPEALRLMVERALERHRLKSRQEGEGQGAPVSLSYGSQAMEKVVGMLRKVAAAETTLLLTGETGTGKEVAARSVHLWSRRSTGPFVAVNCAALSESLLESELFGHEQGAFTGASSRRRGRIELAEGGTCFLDEVGELKPELQAKLLRVLQERTFERVGGEQTIECDVRFIAATNRNLAAMVEAGTFREDLYHRLAVFEVRLPPLRERREDVEPLSRALLARIRSSLGRPGLTLAEEAVRRIVQGEWPGNVRQLSNFLERAAILSTGDTLGVEIFEGEPVSACGSSQTGGEKLSDLERGAIREALAASGGNRRRAAQNLGIGLRTLYEKLKRYDLG